MKNVDFAAATVAFGSRQFQELNIRLIVLILSSLLAVFGSEPSAQLLRVSDVCLTSQLWAHSSLSWPIW